MRNHARPCPRCHGMMVETYSDLLSPSDKGGDVFVWRWVNCGDYVDQLVLLNRWGQQDTLPPPLPLMRGPSTHHRSQLSTFRQRQAVT